MDDTTFWIDHEVYGPDEIVIRFKHRIVSIHCFANGNGRHSRLIADILIYNLFPLPVYSWGSFNFIDGNELRSTYLTAIKQADNGEMQALIAFSRL